MRIRVILIVLSAVLFISGCSVNPVTGESEFNIFGSGYEQDIQMGAQASAEVEKEFGSSSGVPASVSNYVSYIGRKVATVSHSPQLAWKWTVLNSDTVNAFALPGGYVYITTGMLKNLQTEAQLAAILCHEAIHITARHSTAAMSQQALVSAAIGLATTEQTQSAVQVANVVAQLQSLSYSREHERQADAYGLDYLVKAGYNPYAMVEVMQLLQRLTQTRTIEFFSTHPSPENREQLIKNKIMEKNYPMSGFDGAADYKQNVLSQF